MGKGKVRFERGQGSVRCGAADMRQGARDIGLCSKEYWSIIGEFNGGEPATDFIAKLAKKDGVKVELNNEGDAQSVLKALEGADYCVSSVETKAINRRPAAPFTTSKLQQEAAKEAEFYRQEDHDDSPTALRGR